jgi:hypothetical protein
MENSHRSTAPLNWFAFLRLEAELAETFIQSAKAHADPAIAAGSLRNARKALSEIQLSLLKPAARGLSKDEIVFLQKRCTQIESALNASGL